MLKLAAWLLLSTFLVPAAATACEQNACANILRGVVSSGEQFDARPIADAHVAIYQAREGDPLRLAEAVTNARGEFIVSLPKQRADKIRYGVAVKGAVEFMTVLAAEDRPIVRVNEMTTVSSAYAMAQFLSHKRISGKTLPLKVAAGMFRNLASPADGRVSSVLVNPPNADQTNARRLMATLSNVLAGCVRNEGRCATLFRLTDAGGATPATTLESIISISRNPASNVRAIFRLGNDSRPYQPALTAELGPDAPNHLMRLDAFTVAVKVNATGRKNRSGEELCPFGGAGDLVFDQSGRAWITNNVIQGQAVSSTCFYVLNPDGTPSDGRDGAPNSPLFGGGVLGQGYGVTRDPAGNIWAGNFGWGGVNPVGSVSKFSPSGRPLSPASGYVSTLDRVQGTASDQAGNIWMASYSGNTVNVFPAGNPGASYPAYQDGNTEPFDIVIDDSGAGWVSYTAASALSKFTFTADGLVKQFTMPIGSSASPKGIGLDTAGNAWATAGAESRIYAFSPSGRQIGAFSGGGVTGPWGLSVDSKDNVWIANFGPSEQLDLKYRLSRLCGVSEENCPRGMRVGDPISPETGYTLPSGGDEVRLASGKPLYAPLNVPSYKPLMRATATEIDMAGNVWVTNNWKPSGLNDIGTSGNPGGDGMVIFIGLAAPVKPGIGQPKAP